MVRSMCFCFHLPIGIFFISSLILSVNHWLLSSTLFMSYFSISLFSPLSRTYSSAASFCLNCYLYFYVYDRLVTFLDLGEVAFCRRHPIDLTVHSPLITQAICSRVSLKRAAWGLLSWQTDYVGSVWSVWLAPSLIGFQALPVWMRLVAV